MIKVQAQVSPYVHFTIQPKIIAGFCHDRALWRSGRHAFWLWVSFAGAEVAVSFFGHHVYFTSGDAVLVLTETGSCKLERPDAVDNLYLMQLIETVDQRYNP